MISGKYLASKGYINKLVKKGKDLEKDKYFFKFPTPEKISRYFFRKVKDFFCEECLLLHPQKKSAIYKLANFKKWNTVLMEKDSSVLQDVADVLEKIENITKNLTLQKIEKDVSILKEEWTSQSKKLDLRLNHIVKEEKNVEDDIFWKGKRRA